MFLRQRQRRDAIAVGVRFALGSVGVSQFVLNDAELFAQVGLPFAPVDGGLDLALQVAIERGLAEIAVDPVDQELQPLDGMDGLQQKLLLLQGKVHEGGKQVGELVGPFDHVHAQNVQQLVRVFRVALDQFLEKGERLVHQVIGLDGLRNRFRRDLPKHAFEVGLGLHHLHELDALPSLQKDLVAVRREGKPLHDGSEHSDVREILGARILFVTALLAERGDQVLVVGEALQKPDVPVDADLERQHSFRKED